MSTLAEIAPRLYQAYVERKEEIRLQEMEWRALESKRVTLEKLVIHRELQYLRACSRNSQRYVWERHKKLKDAQGALDRVLKRRARLAKVLGKEV